MFGWLTPRQPTVEQWANHNKDKASADDLIAGAIVASFAKDYKHWKFEGDFHQRHDSSSSFRSTTLTRKMPTKKDITIVFLFRQTSSSDGYSTIYKHKVIGCEVNGIRLDDKNFSYIYKAWNNIVVEMKRTEEVAEQAKANMERNEKAWDLAEGLLGMKRDGLGVLRPIKTAEAE